MKKPAEKPARNEEVRRLRAEVASLRGAVALLHRIGLLVGGELEPEPTCYAVLAATTAGVGLGLDRAMIFLAEPGDRARLRGAAGLGPADRAEAERIWRAIEAAGHDQEALYEAGLRHPQDPGALDRRVRAAILDVAGDTPIARAFRGGDLVSGEGADDAGGLLHLATAIAAPLRDAHGVFGVLYGDDGSTGRRLDPVKELVFRMVADHAGRALANARRFEEMAGAARTDALTGLRHHGAFMTDLGREVASATEHGRPLGLAMIDLDGFKQVNDTLGHVAGDALLAGLAARMRGVMRGGEGLYRYGGDEFAAIIPGADRAAAALVGERLRDAIAGRPFALGKGRKIRTTCSVGVASIPEDARDATALVEAADAAMFRAKAGGKDAVVAAG